MSPLGDFFLQEFAFGIQLKILKKIVDYSAINGNGNKNLLFGQLSYYTWWKEKVYLIINNEL